MPFLKAIKLLLRLSHFGSNCSFSPYKLKEGHKIKPLFTCSRPTVRGFNEFFFIDFTSIELKQ